MPTAKALREYVQDAGSTSTGEEGEEEGGESEMGEDHIFCYDSAVMQLEKRPTPLQPSDQDIAVGGSAPSSWRVAGLEGGWIGRAPSWAEFRVQKWGGGRLLVVSVHAKSGGGRATRKDVTMIGRAVRQLQTERRKGMGR